MVVNLSIFHGSQFVDFSGGQFDVFWPGRPILSVVNLLVVNLLVVNLLVVNYPPVLFCYIPSTGTL